MNATEKLQEVKDEEELNRKGFFKVTCPSCRGLGYFDFSIAGVVLMPKCFNCKGDGISWELKEAKGQE